MQAAELAKLLEEKWGVSAAAPVAATCRRTGRCRAAPAEEQTEFDVILLSAGDKKIQVGVEDLIRADAVRRVAPIDIVDEATGEVIVECNEELDARPTSRSSCTASIHEFAAALPRSDSPPARRCATRCSRTRRRRQDEAILEIYRRLRPGDPPTIDTATNLFDNLFFNPERYDLSRVGRLKLNHKLELRRRRARDVPAGAGRADPTRGDPARASSRRCAREDILAAVKYLVDLKNGTTRASASTTSTTSATAACASSASCSRTSTASASCAWSARSRSA